MDNVQHFLGTANPAFLLLNSRSLQGTCRERCAASIGSVLANIENDIAKIQKIKSGYQYKYMNCWKRPELTPDVCFFLLSKYRRVAEMMRIQSLVCGNSTRKGLHGTTTEFHTLPWTYSVIHFLFGAKHEIVFKHMSYRFWKSDFFF